MARDTQPQFNESGMAYELSTRDFSGADERQPVLEDNEAHAPGKICERCGQALAAGQDARLLPEAAGSTRRARWNGRRGEIQRPAPR